MQIQITEEQAQLAGFISWERLATELFKNGRELAPDEHIVRLEITVIGINYFVKKEIKE